MTVEEMNVRKRELGYSYEQISELSGVPLSTVRKVLGGITTAPRYKTLQALSEAFPKAESTVGTMRVQGSRTQDNGTQSGFHYTGIAPEDSHIMEGVSSYGSKKQGDYTLEDYLALPVERRVELIDGVFYDMGSPTGFHQLIIGQIYTELLAFIKEKGGGCLPFISPVDVQLDCDNRTIVQPDVLVLCNTDKYTPARIVGAPDFVVEILSPSTRSKDMFIKMNKYRNAGVREFWVVDPDKKAVLTFCFENGDMYGIYSFRDSIPVGIFNGECVIDFAAIDDYVSPWM